MSVNSSSHADDREAGAEASVEVESLPGNIRSIQPGGGVCMTLELLWGRWRRWYLKRCRRGYLGRMAAWRLGDDKGYPHEILDPRDLKFCRNQGNLRWPIQHDPFAWRDRLPFARAGLAELMLFGGGCLLLAVVAYFVYWPLALLPLLLLLEVVWFFRDPRREIPQEPGAVVAPADGKVVSIDEIDHDEFLGGPAVVVGIFLSVFNVHINRVPVACRILGLTYAPGKFLNALRPESARENEWLEIRVEQTASPHRRMKVRQIAGALARRIVCWVSPGEALSRGQQFGMIKLGSRTELTLPRDGHLTVLARLGQKVYAGTTVLAQYATPADRTADDSRK